MSITYVHTLGDGLLDNVYWMLDDKRPDMGKARETAVEGLLECRLKNESCKRGPKSEYTVDSFAYYDFDTNSVLNGGEVGEDLGIGRQTPKILAYMEEKLSQKADDESISPLGQLQNKVEATPDATHYVVISVLRKDFREILKGSCWQSLRDISEIQSRYLKIVDTVISLNKRKIRPILMFQYRTEANADPHPALGKLGAVAIAIHLTCFVAIFSLTVCLLAGKISLLSAGIFVLLSVAIIQLNNQELLPLSVIGDVLEGNKEIRMVMLGIFMEIFYRPILEKAEHEKIPILDLPNSFNPNNKELYTRRIEPNKKSGELIATGLSEIILGYDKPSESKIYRVKEDGGVMDVPNANPADWRVDYPEKIRPLIEDNEPSV